MEKSQNETMIFTDIELTGDEMLMQSNTLIHATKQMNLRELKFFYFLLSKVYSSQPEDLRFRISANVFAKVFGVQSTPSVYRDIPSIIKNLTKKVITIHPQEDENQEVQISPLSYAKYWTEKGYAEVEISPELIPYLFCSNLTSSSS